ncbi:GNAT family N-acetyltransferase [Flavobacterium pectinovorum]|uniref:GNAT family N-acetyltransferase n=1 Tax=Flavobacterium pectinovorum TaxID=29533 RepID=A0A502EBW4_9FLAO|nr:GNAT family N-acetyltransferase [Flavobacterium pectinovorum]TPG34824.1 GNAT family N-acetyltransferase [Flavobacterium pectinovorum]
MNLFLRQAELKDVEFIAELSSQLGYKTSLEKIQNRISEILNNADNCVYVIIDNENIIGWIHGFYSLRVESDSFVEIGGLVVDENYRRKGVGKILVTKVIEWACSKKSNKIRVRCNTLRKETHVFYDRIGFIETKEQKIFDMELA